MSSKQKAELQEALDNYHSNRSPENITASANSTRKIVDLVRGGVTVPKEPIGEVAEQNVVNKPSSQLPAEEPEWGEILRSLTASCDLKPVEDSAFVVNQLTNVPELTPRLANQLTTVANQTPLVNHSTVVSHPSPSAKARQGNSVRDERVFRSRKDRRLKGIRISAEKLERYELWCVINKTSFQDAVERALDWLTSGQPVNHVLIDDRDDDELKNICKSTSSSTLEQMAAFYCQWTKNIITEEDHRAMREIADLDLNTVKLGILVAMCRKASSRQVSRKINSFRYFLGSIREVARSRMGKAVTERILQTTMRSLLSAHPDTPALTKRSQP